MVLRKCFQTVGFRALELTSELQYGDIGDALLYMVSRHRARTGELEDAETSKIVLRSSVSHKQKAS